jgi:predicted ATPase
VTFLFTDVEGSTRLWEAAQEAMRFALQRHDVILRSALDAHGGYVFATGGDAFSAAFARASDAVEAARDAQAGLAQEDWPEGAVLLVRMGLHTGEASERDGDYFGPAVNRAARIMSIAHGGQVLCSEVTAGLVKDAAILVDLGPHRLRDLSAPQRIFQVGEGVFPPARAVDAYPGNLPLQLSSFVGRQRELERTGQALAEARVVTLTGVGGVGKTRLALQVAGEVLPRFSEGAWLCELAPLRDPAGVTGTVANLFDVVPRGGQSMAEALMEFLRGKQMLLVLDNCEHLLGATAELVERLERSCPGLVVLATSREGLGTDGERILVVSSLAAPPADGGLDVVAGADAVRLFVDRAQAVKAEFALTEQNASSVAQLCWRLDGIPLAIELAAARVPAMTPAELARRLERRFEVLAGGRRGAVERHQTLRAAIDWSYELATSAQRRLLARLAVFAGGCTLEAAEAVCAGEPVDRFEVWQLMATLVAQSLVVAEEQGLDTRYRLLETIRQYAEERLDEHGETSTLRRRHADFYVALACDLQRSYYGPEQVPVRMRLAAEQENIQRAMSTAVDDANLDLAFRLLLAVPLMSNQTGFGFYLAPEPVLALPAASEHPDFPMALALAAGRVAGHGENERAEQILEQAMTAARRLGRESDGLLTMRLNNTRSLVAINRGAWQDAARIAEQQSSSLAHLTDRASHLGAAPLAASIISAAQCHLMAGDADVALVLATEGLGAARHLGMPYLITMGLAVLAGTLVDRDPEQARALLREGIR